MNEAGAKILIILLMEVLIKVLMEVLLEVLLEVLRTETLRTETEIVN